MKITDPISDMLTRIRSKLSWQDSVSMPSSKVLVEIAQRLITEEGLCRGLPLRHQASRITTSYKYGKKRAKGYPRHSSHFKPGLRIYSTAKASTRS